MTRKRFIAMTGSALFVVKLISGQVEGQPSSFTYYPSVIPAPEIRAILDLGEYEPRVGREKLRDLVSRTSDRALVANLLYQIVIYDGNIGDKQDQRLVLQRLIREYPNSNWELAARDFLITVDIPVEDQMGRIRATDQLVTHFGGPSVGKLAARDAQAIARLRSTSPKLRQSLGTTYGDLAGMYADLKQSQPAIAFAQLNREMNFSGEDPLSVLKLITGKFWAGQITQNPVVKVVKPTRRRTGNRPRIVVEISDGDYREPQLNWEKFEFKLDGQDLKMKAMNKSQFDTQLRENRIFERLRMIYRPETPLAPGQHTLLIYAPVHGYKGTGLGATRLEYRFQVPPSNQRNSNDRDDEGAEADDHDFR